MVSGSCGGQRRPSRVWRLAPAAALLASLTVALRRDARPALGLWLAALGGGGFIYVAAQGFAVAGQPPQPSRLPVPLTMALRERRRVLLVRNVEDADIGTVANDTSL